MTRNNNRFANRETTVKGFVINLETQTQEPFETKTQYTRSNDKAVAYARKALKLDDNPRVIVAVTELVNESPAQIKYDEDKIYELALEHVYNEADAQTAAEDNGAIYRKVARYSIDGWLWFKTDDSEFGTTFYKDYTPVNMTKCDMRAFIALSYEMANDGYKVIGTHNVRKHALDCYCVIKESDLSKCIKS